MAAQLLGLGRRIKIALWVWFGVTMLGTIYLGWHYVVDNIAGVILGTIALILAGLITGIDPRAYRQRPRTAAATPGRGWRGPGRSDDRRAVVSDTP
jgi:membrane-associated phospholipid phosphatase